MASAEGATLRAFVALPFGGEGAGELLREARERLGEESRRWYRFPPAQNAHLTLRFLGEIPVESVVSLTVSLERVLAGTPSRRLSIDRVGAFPRRGSERVLWAGFDPEAAGWLAGLERRVTLAVDEALGDEGRERRREDFRPHLTLARPRPGARVPAEFYDWRPGLEWKPGEVLFLRSDPGEGPPRYTRLAGWGLSG